MFVTSENVKERKDEFARITTDQVREYVIDSFITQYELFKMQFHMYNAAIRCLPFHLLKGNPRKFFYENYDEYCVDILAIYEEFAKKEADFESFHTKELPIEIFEILMCDEDETHIEKINQHILDLTREIIIQPFFKVLMFRMFERKLGSENYNIIKPLIPIQE